jgi:ABC-type transport system substrate-binding protein
VFSINRLMEEGSAQRGYWSAVESVEAQDASTLKITTKFPSATLLTNIAFGFNKMMAPEAVAAGGGNLQQGPNAGTGAWIVECEVDVQCVYHRNPDFHLKDEAGNQLPYLDALRNIIMPDVQARFAAFRAKKLDVHSVTTEQRIITEKNYPEVEIDEYKAYGSTFIHFRTDQAPWNDKRVRQAVSKAVDRQEIIDVIYDGRAHFSMAMAMPSAEAYLPDEEFVAAWTQDIPEAKRLLAEAGFPDGLDAKMWVANYSETYIALVELMQQQLKEAGIRVELFIHDRPVYLSRVFTRHGEFEDMAYGPQGTFTADSWLNAYYHSDGGRNSSWVNDPVLDAMIEEQSQELDTGKRDQQLLEIQRYLIDQTYQAVVRSGMYQSAYWPWIRNRATSAGGDYPGARLEEVRWVDQAIYDKFN